jgi:hypothetical protein
MWSRIFFALSVVTLLVLSACTDEEIFEPVEKDRTYLHFLNAYPGIQSVDITFESSGEIQSVARRVKFLNSWPNSGYASLLTALDTINGQGGVDIHVANHATREELVPAINNNLRGDERYTFILVDSFSKPIVVRAIDNVEAEIPAAYVRMMNVNRFVQSASLETKDGQGIIRSLNFLNYSGYQQLQPGTYTFYFVDDRSGRRLDSIPNVNLRFNKTYSFYLTHDPEGGPVGGLKVMESTVRP